MTTTRLEMTNVPRFEIRKNCEYIIEIDAENADDAMDQANKLDLDGWDQAWSGIEAEELPGVLDKLAAIEEDE